MGIYLNPDNKGFEQAIRSKIYVDKTGLIACTNELLNTKERFACVSRPRRKCWPPIMAAAAIPENCSRV